MLSLIQRYFEDLTLPESFTERMEQLTQEGPVVYVLRSRSGPDMLALHAIIEREHLPRLGYTHDLPLGPFQARGRRLSSAFGGPHSGADQLQRALVRRESALLFLKRPPHLHDTVTGRFHNRGLKKGDELLLRLLEMQAQMPQPIHLVPVVFVWTNRADTQGAARFDALIGPREWPSTLRSIGQVMANHRNGEMRLGEPLSLDRYLADQGPLPQETLVRRLVYILLRRVERERRSVTGPAQLPPDLLRRRVLRTPQLQSVVRRMAGDNERDRAALLHKADSLLQEMQSVPNSATRRASKLFLDSLFRRLYASIDVDHEGLARLREHAKEGTLVLLPSHKSHMDSLVVSYVFETHHLGLPLVAAGDNLAFFPLGPIARRAGAFFIRRSFAGDRLYAATVEAYLRRLLRDGHTLEVFLEGGRSRTGKLLKPQVGLLNILVNAALSMERRPVFFVPISIGYERLIEADAFQSEMLGDEKVREDATALLRGAELLRTRYGRVDVQFGQAQTLGNIRAALELPPAGELPPAKRRAVVRRLAYAVMDEIDRATEVTPGALTALSLLSDVRRAVPHEVLIERCHALLSVLKREGARIHPRLLSGPGLRAAAIREAVQLYLDAGFATANEPDADVHVTTAGPRLLYRVQEDKRTQLSTAKNHIVHFFVDRALISVAMLMGPSPAQESAVRHRADSLADLLTHEFRLDSPLRDPNALETTIAQLVAEDVLVREDGRLAIGLGSPTFSGLASLLTYRAILQTFLEGYLIAATALRRLGRGAMDEDAFFKRAVAVGERMHLTGGVRLRESISKPVFENALLTFHDEGYVRRKSGQVELTDSLADEQAVRTVAARVRAYLEVHKSHRHPALAS